MTLGYHDTSIRSLVPGILILMSSDNVAHRIYNLWHAAMPLQFVLSENRACHSRQGKETHLKSAVIVALHAIISISHLDGLISYLL